MKPTCPSTDELHQLLSSTLPEMQQERCARHLDACECCQAKLEELATGGTNLSQLVEQVHAAQPAAASAYWPAIRAAAGQSVHLAATLAPDAPARLRDSSTHF